MGRTKTPNSLTAERALRASATTMDNQRLAEAKFLEDTKQDLSAQHRVARDLHRSKRVTLRSLLSSFVNRDLGTVFEMTIASVATKLGHDVIHFGGKHPFDVAVNGVRVESKARHCNTSRNDWQITGIKPAKHDVLVVFLLDRKNPVSGIKVLAGDTRKIRRMGLLRHQNAGSYTLYLDRADVSRLEAAGYIFGFADLTKFIAGRF